MEEKVKKMYTEYTYPNYSDYMDKNAPIPYQYSNCLFLEQLNYYAYNGKNDFNNFNILVAGCGLGGDLINMAYFLKNKKNSKLVGIDLSPTSLNICKKRIEKYNLKNIKLIEMSLLNLDPNIHGKFDLIICIGVLHHLEDPSKGLNSLKNVLKDIGIMNIMVYGKYGRTGIYQMQDLLKKINIKEMDFSKKIENYKNLYKQLPRNNWFKLGEHLIGDHKVSDEGIVDLLLHHQDRAYSISELYEWVNNCNLKILEFAPHYRYKYKYNIPKIKYSDNNIDKYSINEIFFGDIIKHNFYVSKKVIKKCDINDLNNILILVCITKTNLTTITNKWLENKQNNIINVTNLPLQYNYKTKEYQYNN